jgi:hypothetical protein
MERQRKKRVREMRKGEREIEERREREMRKGKKGFYKYFTFVF